MPSASNSDSTLSTGYGAQQQRVGSTVNISHLCFTGKPEDYETWEEKVHAFLSEQGYDAVLGVEDLTSAEAVQMNKRVYNIVIQILDRESIRLVRNDGKHNGRKVFDILRNYYCGTGRSKILSLFTEVGSLKKEQSESVTNYILRAEEMILSLKQCKHPIEDMMAIALVVKGLPSDYRHFRTIVFQTDNIKSFEDLKAALINYEHDEIKMSSESSNEMVLNVKSNYQSKLKCFTCNKTGHKSYQCKDNVRNASNGSSAKWCKHCKSNTHNYKSCYRKDSAKQVADVVGAGPYRSGQTDFLFSIDSSISSKHVFPGSKLLVDCGATTHIVYEKDKFEAFDEDFDEGEHVIELADGSQIRGIVEGRGTAVFQIQNCAGKYCKVRLASALYLPSFHQNIFSVQAAVKNGVQLLFKESCTILTSSCGEKFPIEKKGKLYYLNSLKGSAANSLRDWHRILGHTNTSDILKLQKVVKGMKITSREEFECSVCAEGKLTRCYSRVADDRAQKPMEFVHLDIAGPMNIPSRQGSKYAMCFVDDFTNTVFVYFLVQKSEALDALKRFLSEAAPYGTVKRLRSDNAAEFCSANFKSVLYDNKIKAEYSAPHSPHQNGTAERMWRTLFEMARCLLIDANLPKKFWNYAIRTAAYIRNRSYCSRLGKTPYEALTNKEPDLSNMNLFGCICYAYVEIKKKLDARSEQGVFVGYDPLSPAYLVFFKDSDEIKRIRVVKFFKKVSDEVRPPISEPPGAEVVVGVPPPAGDRNSDVPDRLTGTRNNSIVTPEVRQPEDNSTVASEVQEPENNSALIREPVRRNPTRPRGLPVRMNDYVTEGDSICYIHHCCYVSEVPNNYNDALTCSVSEHWLEAMNEEIAALKKNEVYEECDLPSGRTALGGRWVYAVKNDGDGGVRYKARYVARGYTEKNA